MNKGDIILIVICLSVVAFTTADMWLIISGYEQFSTQLCAVFGAVFGGETLAFALYKVGKGRNEYKAAKSAVVQTLDREDAGDGPAGKE